VIAAVWVPAVSDPVAALTVSAPGPVPEAGDRTSQAALSLALHVRVPPPVLLMLRVWAAGFPLPCCAVNDRLLGPVPIAGGTGAGVTVKVTGIDTLGAPEALRVIAAVWVPAVRAPVVTVNVTIPLPMPEAGLKVNHPILAVALQFNVPPPLLVTVTI
jgi:hypothetical protein